MFGLRAAKTDTDTLTAVVAGGAGVSLARVKRAPGQLPTVLFWDFVPVERTADLGKALKRLAKSRSLARTRCTTVLEPNTYRILLTEAPNVPKDEVVPALRWVIKDMIDTPVQDLNLQVFDFPDTGNEKEKQIYVVAAQQDKVTQCVDLLRDNAVDLEIIDIMELAQRNLAELLPENTRGTALVTFSAEACVITLSKQGTLFVTRRVDIPPQQWQQSPEAAFERIALEVQRSLDYYNRHFRQAPIEHVYITPATFDTRALIDFLSRFFPSAPRLLDLSELLLWATPLPPALQPMFALTVGAALRREEEDDAATG